MVSGEILPDAFEQLQLVWAITWYQSQYASTASPHLPRLIQIYLQLMKEEVTEYPEDAEIIHQLIIQFPPLKNPALPWCTKKSLFLKITNRFLLEKPTTPIQAAVVPVYLNKLHAMHTMLCRWHSKLKRVQTVKALGEEGYRRRRELQLTGIIRHWHMQVFKKKPN